MKSFVYKCVAASLLLVAFSGCECVCMDRGARPPATDVYGTYRIDITECPYEIKKVDVYSKLKEKMGRHLVETSWDVGDNATVDLKVKINDEEKKNLAPVVVLCIPFAWTLGVFPVYVPTDHHVAIEIECANATKGSTTELEETHVMSSLPWAYLPLLWHDVGMAKGGDGGASWYDDPDMNALFVEQVADSILSSLTKDFYLKAVGGSGNE